MALLKGLISGDWLVGRSGRQRAVRFDSSTHSLHTVDYAHHEVHAGSSYNIVYSVPDLGAMATPADEINISFTTPDTTKWMHMIFSAIVGGEALFQVIEAPTGGLTSPTGQLTAINHNRNSSKVTGVSAFNYDGATPTGGTTLISKYIGQGNANPGQSRAENEFVLKQNTLYAVRLYDTTNITAAIILDWYEHTDRN